MKNEFRTHIIILFAQAAGIFWSLTLLRRAYYYFSQQTWIPIHSATVIGGTIGMALAALAISWFYKVKIHDNKVKGPNIWGGFSVIPISSGIFIEEKKFLWFRYLRISGGNKKSIWVPLPVSRQAEMMSLLKSNCGNVT
jgi:hypothetical protein